MRATSGKYKELRVGSIKFHDGAAEVTEAQAARLRRLPAHYGVQVEAPAKEPANDAGGPFNPAEHNAPDVLAYLEGLPDDDHEARDTEVRRVLEAEKASKNRKGIIEAIEGAPAN